MNTHQGVSVRDPDPADDNGQLAARTHLRTSVLVDCGTSWTACCCYFRTCLALPVPRGLQELLTFVPPFAMFQCWCWSSGSSSASCLCFCSAFSLQEARRGSELENGGLCPLHREIYPRSLALLFRCRRAPPYHTKIVNREPRTTKSIIVCDSAAHVLFFFLAPIAGERGRRSWLGPLSKKSPQSCTGEIQGIGSAFTRVGQGQMNMTAPASHCGG